MSLDRALTFTLRWEGGYVNIQADPGGETNLGIADMRDGVKDGRTDVDGDRKPDTAIKDLTLEQAKTIYKRDYWDKAGCGNLPEPLDMCHFDVAVNMGPSRAAEFLRKAGGSHVKYNDLREAFYHGLVAKKPGMAVFMKGWLNRLNALRAACG